MPFSIRNRVFALLALLLANIGAACGDRTGEVATLSDDSGTYAIKSCTYVGLRHSVGKYLTKGRVSVDAKIGGRIYSFTIDEELRPFALHISGERLIAVFEAEYEPGRGFLAFSIGTDGNIVPLPLAQLTLAASVPNLPRTSKDRKELLAQSSQPTASFYETRTAKLWSQMKTGKVALTWGVSRQAVQSILSGSEWKQGAKLTVDLRLRDQ